MFLKVYILTYIVRPTQTHLSAKLLRFHEHAHPKEWILPRADSIFILSLTLVLAFLFLLQLLYSIKGELPEAPPPV